jgi:hypothetical protein
MTLLGITQSPALLRHPRKECARIPDLHTDRGMSAALTSGVCGGLASEALEINAVAAMGSGGRLPGSLRVFTTYAALECGRRRCFGVGA